MIPKKHLPLVIALLLLLIIGVAITVSFLSPKKTTQQEASGATVLSFSPESGNTTPLQKSINDTIDLDLMVDPGTDAITFIKFQIHYDSTKISIDQTNPFTLNTIAFSGFVEGPVIENGTITESVSVGADPTKAIRIPTKIGTLHIKTIATTGNTPTSLSFSNQTQVLSAGSNATASQNVLGTTNPAFITITDGTQPTTTQSPTATPTVPQTTLSFSLLLHGIGSAGDNPNPTGNDLSNKDPLTKTRNLDVLLYDNANKLVSNTPGTVTYNATTGTFDGTVAINQTVPNGVYTIKIKSDRYLRRLVPEVITIKSKQNNDISKTELIAGDTDNNNILNVLDYNALLDCGYGELSPLPISNSHATFYSQECQAHQPTINNDLNDNGIINAADYNLFIRELSVQSGD